MPLYCYRHPKTGKLTDHFAPFGKAPKSVTLADGTVCARCLAAELASQNGPSPRCWPQKSVALAVHPSQRKQYAEFASKHGIPTSFDEQGHPVFESRGHRKRYAELVGATDFDGGYGDPHSDR